MSDESTLPHPSPETPPASDAPAPRDASLSRRGLLSGGTALGLAARLGLAGAAPVALSRVASAADIGPVPGRARARQAKVVRIAAAQWQFDQPGVQHPDNGDDALYPIDRRGSYTKGLPHDANGIVDATQYQNLLYALSTGKHADFEQITMGNFARLVSPQAAYAFELEGPDSHHLTIPVAPTFASARTAAEMVELYWMALTRDVPFSQYETHPLIAQACAELSGLDYGGPSVGGVIPQILFRSAGLNDVLGPYVSQFLWQRFPFGAMDFHQRYKVPVQGDDYVLTFPKWIEVQNGWLQAQDNVFHPESRYLCNGRDVGQYVHKDFPFQAFVNATIYLCDLGLGGATLAATNPYKQSVVQGGFVMWGRSFFVDMVARVANQALKAAWYQKWLVHRRVRPEKLGALIHRHMTGAATYDIHPSVLGSQALALSFAKHGSYLLPQAFPEAAPLHPAYPSGHATYSGACATVLKALFNENFVIPNPVVANDDGTQLLPYTGPTLTVRGELDKLAYNVSMPRATAGVHYRSDIEDGLLLGEQVAKKFLKDMLLTFNEPFTGFQFTGFDGNTVTIA